MRKTEKAIFVENYLEPLLINSNIGVVKAQFKLNYEGTYIYATESAWMGVRDYDGLNNECVRLTMEDGKQYCINVSADSIFTMVWDVIRVVRVFYEYGFDETWKIR